MGALELISTQTNQLDLIPYDYLSSEEASHIVGEIRRAYWHIRSLRNAKYSQANLRRIYRRVEVHKKRLFMAGVDKRSVLDLLACCRLQCRSRKHPFTGCAYCSIGR